MKSTKQKTIFYRLGCLWKAGGGLEDTKTTDPCRCGCSGGGLTTGLLFACSPCCGCCWLLLVVVAPSLPGKETFQWHTLWGAYLEVRMVFWTLGEKVQKVAT